MEIRHHVIISTALSGILYLVFRSWGLTITSLVAGICIDLDHVIDYVLEHGFHFNRKKFFCYFYGEKYRRITLIFHGWEWLVVLLFFSWWTGWDPVATGVLVGCGQHMIFDRAYNISTFMSYSLLWRWKNGFDPKKFLLKNRDRAKAEAYGKAYPASSSKRA